jgi:membrane-anchored mycosin MYCP
VRRPRRPAPRRGDGGATAFRTSVVLLLIALAAGSGAGPALAGPNDCVVGRPEAPAAAGWAQENLGLDALSPGFQGWDTSIAVIGSGVDVRHPALGPHVAPGARAGTDADPLQDCLGVGTAVAGAAAAAPIAGSALRGVAPQALVVPIRVPDWMANPRGDVRSEDARTATEALVTAIRTALDRRVRVIVLPSVSLPDSDALRQAVAAAERAGAVLVEGAPSTFTDATAFPLAYPEVLGVVEHDRAGTLGKTPAPPRLLDLTAPGTDVPALGPGGYLVESGSPLAAGVVAGTAALVVDAAGGTPAAIRDTLVRSARYGGLVGGVPAISPAAALGPVPGPATPPPSFPWRTATVPEAVQMAPHQAVVTTVGCVLLLVAGGLAAHAYQRGRRRRWRPAGPTDPEQLIVRTPPRSI